MGRRRRRRRRRRRGRGVWTAAMRAFCWAGPARWRRGRCAVEALKTEHFLRATWGQTRQGIPPIPQPLHAFCMRPQQRGRALCSGPQEKTGADPGDGSSGEDGEDQEEETSALAIWLLSVEKSSHFMIVNKVQPPCLWTIAVHVDERSAFQLIRQLCTPLDRDPGGSPLLLLFLPPPALCPLSTPLPLSLLPPSLLPLPSFLFRFIGT